MPDTPGESVYISVVAPAYNEADNLPRFVAEICDVMTAMGRTWEIVIALDRGTDDSPAVLRRLAGQHPQLRIIEMSRRSGQSAALEAALRAARGRYIATMDSDLQNDPADIPAMLEPIEQDRCDLINGWRRDRKDTFSRRLVSGFGNAVRNRLTGETIHDSGCGLKVFRRECVERVKFYTGMHRFFATLVRYEGWRVDEMVTHHRARSAGVSKYGFWDRFFKFLRDAVAVRWMRKRIVTWQASEWAPTDDATGTDASAQPQSASAHKPMPLNQSK